MNRLPLAMCLALLVAIPSGVLASDFFPLDGTHTWTYRVTRLIKGEEHRQKIVLAGLPERKVEDATYYPVRRLDDQVVLYQKTEDGIFRLGEGGAKRARVLPAKAETGAKWEELSSIHFLEVTGTFAATFEKRVQSTIALEHVIESTDDTVETAAGRFEHCLRVKAAGSMFAGSTLETFMGIRFIKVERTDWYAPGVGLVKRTRTESTTPAEWSNEYTEELEAFE